MLFKHLTYTQYIYSNIDNNVTKLLKTLMSFLDILHI